MLHLLLSIKATILIQSLHLLFWTHLFMFNESHLLPAHGWWCIRFLSESHPLKLFSTYRLGLEQWWYISVTANQNEWMNKASYNVMILDISILFFFNPFEFMVLLLLCKRSSFAILKFSKFPFLTRQNQTTVCVLLLSNTSVNTVKGRKTTAEYCLVWENESKTVERRWILCEHCQIERFWRLVNVILYNGCYC